MVQPKQPCYFISLIIFHLPSHYKCLLRFICFMTPYKYGYSITNVFAVVLNLCHIEKYTNHDDKL